MIRRLLLAMIFVAGLSGAVFAAERMAQISDEPDAAVSRATIDISDAALPKPAPAEDAAEEAVPAEQETVEEEASVRETTVVPQAPAATAYAKSAPPTASQLDEEVARQLAEVLGTKPVAKSATPERLDKKPIAKAARPEQVKEKPARPEPQKALFKWRGEPKKAPTPEEEVQRKIEGKAFRGETGFTTVTTYRTTGIKASGAPAPKIAPTGGTPVMLDINDCIKIAEANHIQALVAKKSIKLAEMRLFEARRNLLPSATVVVERSKGRVNDLGYLGRKQYIEGQQPIFHGGELYYTMKQAEVNLQIAKNDHNRVKNELVLQVKKAYYTLEKAKENSALQHILSREVERIYNIAAKGYEAGATAKVEYLNVSSQASQVKYQLASADGDASVAELILKQAMNVNPKDNFDIVPSPEFKRVTLDFEKTMRDAFVNRPEIKANALMVTYYSYGKGIANAKSLPKIDLLGQWGLAWEDFMGGDFEVNTSPPGQDSPRRKLAPQWYAGIKASVPFAGSTAEYSHTREHWVPVVQTFKGTEANTNSFKFKILDKLDMYSDYQLAEIDYDRSRHELNKTKNDIMLEVKEGCFNYEKALIQLETATNKTKYQEADAELMRMKRGMDEVQDSNVVDSLIKVAQEKFGYVQAVTDCKISLAALEKAVGVQDYFRDR